MRHRPPWIFFVSILCLWPTHILAGMPTPLMFLPDKDSDPALKGVGGLSDWGIARLDAISLFLLVLILCAVIVRKMWNSLRTDFPRLPILSFCRALGLVLVWGCLFMVILTMVSGARELMTPGAWTRQGATYRLTDSQSPKLTPSVTTPPGDTPPVDTPSATANQKIQAERRKRLIDYRFRLMQHAAMHAGKFPGIREAGVLSLPDLPNVQFVYCEGQQANSSKNILLYEPDLGEELRLVLYVNGDIEAIGSPDITQRLLDMKRKGG